jgi:acetyl esterase/lipase
MPPGYLVTLGIVGIMTLAAVVAPRRPHRLGIAVYLVTVTLIEVPLVFLLLFAASTGLAIVEDGLLETPAGWVALVVALLVVAGLLALVRDAARTRAAVEAALGEPVTTPSPWRSRLLPIPWRPREVRRVGPLPYGDAPRQRLDVYRRHDLAGPAPVLVHLHGGGYFSGGRRRESRLLRHAAARRGWVVVSADYRLRPQADWPDHLVDVKRVVAWIREHAHEHGADPSTVVVSGSSAGGHLSVLAALTANDPQLQPGFEEADTTISAAVGLYGYYGRYYGRGPDEDPVSDPFALTAEHAPPIFLVHGDHDTYTSVEAARDLAVHLRQTAPVPVLYAELPGAQHGFDILASERFEAVTAAVVRFLDREVLGNPEVDRAR